jgi:hypothetical protein
VAGCGASKLAPDTKHRDGGGDGLGHGARFDRGFAACLISRKVGGRFAAGVNSRPDTKLGGAMRVVGSCE